MKTEDPSKEAATGGRRKNARASGPPSFEEIQPVSLTERVINALKDSFLRGHFHPGDAIVERELARQMNVGTPVVREALISLQGQGFVRRVTNTGTFVTQFSAEEVSQLYALRVELETLALQWARGRVTSADLDDLTRMVEDVVKAGETGDKREFLQKDYAFHRRCWQLSGNPFLAETLERLMAPLFAFVVVASGAPLTASMGREHYDLVNALRSLQEPEFTPVVRRTLTTFAFRWMTSMAKLQTLNEHPIGDVRVPVPA
ncbi:MAG: GntR family transcriptional regulator [Acidobacteriota bacterium]